MKHISELRTTLSDFFDWHKSRLNCLVQILQALFAVRTVNLTQIAAAFKTPAKEESSFRRICRFFTGFSFDISTIVPLIFRLFPLGNKYTLILDRTNWKWGQYPINILVLSVAYLGISIPIFWVVLDLEGNSCLGDRVALLKRAIQRLGVEKIAVLLADREFIGTEMVRIPDCKQHPFCDQDQTEFPSENRGRIHNLIHSSSKHSSIPEGCRLGAVTFIQRFGKALNPHFHFHSCVIDGVFDKKGKFYPIDTLSIDEIQSVQERVRKRVLRLFRKKGLLDSDVTSDMLEWENGGFSLNANVRIEAEDRDGLERLIRYCARPVFSGERLGMVGDKLCYSLPKPTADGQTIIDY